MQIHICPYIEFCENENSRRLLPKSGRYFMKEGLVQNARDVDLSEDKTATENDVQESDEG